MFSQVPNWKDSNTDRNKILNDYGKKDPNDRFNLYCSVYASKANSFNLRLNVDRKDNKIKQYLPISQLK